MQVLKDVAQGAQQVSFVLVRARYRWRALRARQGFGR